MENKVNVGRTIIFIALKFAICFCLLVVFTSVSTVNLQKYETSLTSLREEPEATRSRSTLSVASEDENLGISPAFQQSESLLQKPKHNPTEYSWKSGENQEFTHGILKNRMLSARRNHDCLLIENEATGNLNLWLVGGRYAPNVETMDLVTGEQKYRTKKDEPMLEGSHYDVVLVKNWTTQRQEIWLPCGFQGHSVDGERSMEAMKVIELGYNGSITAIREGPRLDRPRGGCAALALDVNGPTEEKQVCVFGGSDGAHDAGVFLDTISCYDREKKIFTHPFGELPIGGDHHNIVHVPPGQCDSTLPEMLLYLNFRGKPYAAESKEVYARNITRDVNGKVIPEGKWFLFLNDSKAQPWDAGGLVFGRSGRFLYNFGGTHHLPRPKHKSKGKGVATDKVRALDLCGPRWIFNIATLDSVRFAIKSCANNEFAYTCGGDIGNAHGAIWDRQRSDRKVGDRKNGRECEVHRLDDLEREAFMRVS